MKYRVTKTYYKDIVVEANTEDEAREKANMWCLFDNTEAIPADYDEVEEVEE